MPLREVVVLGSKGRTRLSKRVRILLGMEKLLVLVFGTWSCVLQSLSLLACAEDCAILPGHFVNCSYRSFAAIPNKTLPNTSHSLDLSHNSLQNVPGYAFHCLTELIWLDLSFNRISKLDRHAFLNLSNLDCLNLSSNDLLLNPDTYPLEVFQPLVGLKIFHLEDNRCLRGNHSQYPVAMASLVNLRELHTDFPPSIVFTEEFASMTKLETLSSSGSGIPYTRNKPCCVRKIQEATFAPFKNSGIRHFRLAHSCLSELDPNAFEPFRNLTSLELEGNHQVGLYSALQAFKGLQNRSIAHVNLRGCNSFINREKRDFLPDKLSMQYLNTVCAKSLKISDNYVIMQHNFSLTRPDCLEELDMSVHSTDPNLLLWKVNKQHALPFISKLNISSYVGPPPVHQSGLSRLVVDNILLNLTHMDLSFLPMACAFYNKQFRIVNVLNISGWNCTLAPPDLFLNMRNVTELSMRKTCMNFGLDRHYSKGSIFRNMILLKLLDISENKLEYIPKDLFIENHNLKFLGLANNKLFNVPTQIFKGTALELLDLSSNVIQWLSSHEIELLEKHKERHDQFKVLLKDNPFSCSCFSVHFLQWLNQTSIVADFGDAFLCRFPNGSQVRIVDFMENLREFSVSCVSNLWLTISIVASLVIIPLLICCIGYYRRRWYIHYWFYTKCKPTEDMLPEQNYMYDAFVAYNHNDSAWVHHNLRELLEAPNKGLRLCLHHRDFEAGQAIQQNIVDSINNSRKIIIVISHRFVKSTWGEYEIEMAAMRSVQEARTDVIVCVLLEDIPIREMPRSLVNLWQRVTFLQWPETVHDQDLFWDRLFDAVK